MSHSYLHVQFALNARCLMELRSGERLFTIKDIARCVAFDKSAEGVARTARQVRHWTQSDLLRTVSEKATGSGVPRLYEEEPTIEIAAILLELARYGATIDILKPVAKALYEDWTGGGDTLFLATTSEGNAYAQVAWTVDPATSRFVDARVNLFNDFDEDGGGLWAEPSSSILVNLNKVMDRIFPTPWAD